MIKVFKQKGSLTVEAAITVPVFICIIASILFIIKIVYVHEIIQHVLADTANQISTYSYIYSISGIQEINDETEEELGKSKEQFAQQINTLSETYDCFTDLGDKISQDIQQGTKNVEDFDLYSAEKNFDEISQAIKGLGASLQESENVMKEILNDPKKELRLAAYALAQSGLEEVKTELVLKPFVTTAIAKEIGDASLQKADNKLRKLNIADGFQGLDFSQSKLFQDKKNIDIVVSYKMRFGLPVKLMPEMHFVQRIKVKAWLNGEEGTENETTSDIWKLGALERGKKIQQIYGRNLPEYFKTITKFENGTATLVTSINLNSKTYRESDAKLAYEINKAIKDLSEFEGDKKTDVKDGQAVDYCVNAKEIKERCLIVVIPKNSLAEGSREVFSECTRRAGRKGIRMSVEEL